MSMRSLAISILVGYLATASLKADDVEVALELTRQSLSNVLVSSKWIQLQKRQDRWQVVNASLGHFDRDFEWKQLEHLSTLESLRFSGEVRYFARNAGTPDLSGLHNLRKLELLPWDVTESLARSLAILPHFEQIDIHDFQSDGRGRESALVALKHLPRLRRLKLQGMRLTDRMLVHLQALQDLEELDLQGNDELTDAGLAHLSSLQKLKVLNVSLGSKVTTASLGSFKHLADLREFRMAYTNFDPNNFAALRQFTQLESLTCASNTQSTDLSVLADLTSLELWTRTTGTALLPASLRRLSVRDSLLSQFNGAQLPRLEQVQVWSSNIKQGPFVSLENLSQFTNLRRLKINSASDEGLKSIAHLINLEELELQRSGQCECWFGDTGILALRNLHQLRVLKTNALHLTSGVLTVLPNFPHLRQLDITVAADVTDSHLEQIWGLRELRILNLCLTPTDRQIDELFDKLTELSELEELQVNGEISDHALSKLSKLNHLKRLDLSHNHGFTHMGLTQLLQSTPSLEEVTLYAQ